MNGIITGAKIPTRIPNKNQYMKVSILNLEIIVIIDSIISMNVIVAIFGSYCCNIENIEGIECVLFAI